MTSMARELSHQLSMHEMRAAVKRHMETVFGMKLEVTNLVEMAAQMHLDVSFKR